MNLFLPVGIGLAALVESVFLGTLLLFLSAQWWRAPDLTLKRALLVCVVLNFVSAVAGGIAFYFQFAAPDHAVVVGLVGLAAIVGAQWAVAAKLLKTGAWRALAVWLSAWIPLGIVNLSLALATRAMFLEAFIVPTGSMAPNVLGRHGDRICQNCGCPFPVSLVDWEPRGDYPQERDELFTSCPNCRAPHIIDTSTPILNGDRFLADKTTTPVRWSVAVFRKPPEREELYFKRLVGLPGETLQLAGGEAFIDGELLRKRPAEATDMWLPLHDSQFVPREIADGTPRWQPLGEESGWRFADHCWTVDARSGGPHRLEFLGAVTDFLAYNVSQGLGLSSIREHLLGDVLVTCELDAIVGAGGIGCDWEFGDAAVGFEIDLKGAVSIHTKTGDAARGATTGQVPRPLADGDRVGFAVRDGQAYVLFNEQVMATMDFGPEDVESFLNAEETARECRLELWAKQCSIAMKRIVIRRDVYYISDISELASGYSDRDESPVVPLGAEESFLLGDNSARAYDCRFFGSVPTADLVGVVRWIYWPPPRRHRIR